MHTKDFLIRLFIPRKGARGERCLEALDRDLRLLEDGLKGRLGGGSQGDAGRGGDIKQV